MTGEAVVQEVGRPKVAWWPVLRVALVLGWVAWAALSWWVAPRAASLADAQADLASGQAVSYQWGDSWKNETGLFSPGGVQLRQSPSTEGPIFLWSTAAGRQRYTTVEGGVPDGIDDPNQPQQPISADGRALDAALRAWDAKGSVGSAFPAGTMIGVLGIIGVLAFLGVLIYGPRPVTGTKWFWFWLVGGLPVGLGLLWWLIRERPWSATVPPRTGADGEPRPLTWWVGIVAGLLSGLLLSLVVLGLHQVLGDTLVPMTP